MVQVSTQVIPFNSSQPFQLPGTAVSSGTAALIHTAGGIAGEVDSLFITVRNTSAGSRTVTFLAAGSTDPLTVAVPATSDATLLELPFRLEQGTTLTAFCDTGGFVAGDILILIRIDRLTNPAIVPSTIAANVIVAATPTNYTPADDRVEGHLSGIDAALAASGGSVSSFQQNFSTTTTSGDPGANTFRYDNATPASVTNLFVDDLIVSGADLSNLWAALDSGDFIYIVQENDSTKRQLFQISAATVDNTGWFTIPVVHSDGATLPDNGAVCNFTIIATGDSPGGGGREILTAARTYFVRSDGNDSNTGLVNNAGGAFLTPQRAIDVYAGLDQDTFDVTIKFGTTGTFNIGATTLDLRRAIGSGRLIIEGFDATETNTVIANDGSVPVMLMTSQPGTIQLKDLTIDANGENCLNVFDSFMELDNVRFRLISSTSSATALFGGQIEVIGGGYTIDGAFLFPLNIGFNSIFRAVSVTVTTVGTPAWTFAYLLGRLGGIADFQASTFSGTATGNRVDLEQGAHVRHPSVAIDLPGSVDGPIDSTSSYLPV